jgi:hypothetical protein
VLRGLVDDDGPKLGSEQDESVVLILLKLDEMFDQLGQGDGIYIQLHAVETILRWRAFASLVPSVWKHSTQYRIVTC